MNHFFQYTLAEFEELLFQQYGKKAFYSHAIYREIYDKGNIQLSDVKEFIKAPEFYQNLKLDLKLELPTISKIIKADDVTKFISILNDGLEIESVVIPMSHYLTLCISSQVGCKMGCTFCETAQMGLLRNLSVDEIISQVYNAIHILGHDIRNIVFMGMGEPFDNFDNVIQAVKILTEPKGFSFGKSQITISTVGRVDGIQKLAKLNWPRLNLAISLNAPNDQLRSELMPINRIVPMTELKQALLDYPTRKSGLFLIEYVLIKNVNDSLEHALQLVEFLKPLRARINLIPYNPRLNSPFDAPTEEDVDRFYSYLIDQGAFVCRRQTKGRSMMAACGQLGNRELREKIKISKQAKLA